MYSFIHLLCGYERNLEATLFFQMRKLLFDLPHDGLIVEGSDPAVPGTRKQAIELESGGEDNNSQHTKKKQRADLHIISSTQPSNSCPCCHGRPCVYADVLKGLDEFLTNVRPLINCTGTSTDESKRIASYISVPATWTMKLTHPVYSTTYILFS